MLQVKLLEEKEVLEVKITGDFNLESLKKAITEISKKDILKGGRFLDIDLRIEEFTVLDMIQIPEISLEKSNFSNLTDLERTCCMLDMHKALNCYQAIIELQQIILGIFLQVNLASAYLTHEYCHLYGKVAIGINGKSFSIVTQHGS